MTSELSTSTMTRLVVMTDNEVKLSSPVKSPLSINVTRLESRYLQATTDLSTSTMTRLVVMTDKVVKLPTPVKSPFLIEVMRLPDKYLCKAHEIKEHQSHNSASKPRPRETRIVARWYSSEPLNRTRWEACWTRYTAESPSINNNELD